MVRIVLALALALLAACAPRPAPVAAEPTRDRPHYTMDVTLVPETHELRVTGRVIVPAAAPRSTVTFALMDIMTDLAVTSTPPGTLSAPGASLPGTGNAERTLTLAHPAREVEIRFSYVTHAASGFVYHVGPESMFAGESSAWYPQLAAAKATGEIRYHAPARDTLIASGTTTSVEARGAQHTTTVTYARPSMFSFVAGEYVEHTRGGVVPMRVFAMRDRPGLAAYLDGCSRTLEVLVREFGPYPYEGFTLVEAPAAVTRAAGFDGASFEGYIIATDELLDQPFLLAYFAHELGHQWWGNLVAGDGKTGGYLMSEGLAQYGSLRAVEEIEGAAAAERYRRTGYPGYNEEHNGHGYLRFVAAGIDEPVAAAVEGYRLFTHVLANSKGMLALDHVARVMGRARFRDALHDVTRRYAFQTVAWPDFLRVVQAHAERDLSTTFAQWFDRTGAPAWEVEGTPNGHSMHGAIVQRGEPYALELDVVLSGAGQSITRRVAIDGPRTPIALEAPFDIERIDVDPSFQILHWTPAYRAEADAIVEVTRALAKVYEGQADAADALFEAGLARPRPSDPYGVRFRLHVGYARALRNRDKLAAARAQLLAAVAERVRPPELLPWAYATLAMLAAKQGDRDAVEGYAKAAEAAEAAAGVDVGAARFVTALAH